MNPNDNTTINTASVAKLVAKTIDTVINSSPITLRILGNQKPWKRLHPIKFQKGVAGKSFDGLDKFSTEKSDSFINMEFTPTGYEVNVVVSQMEVDVNKARERYIDIVARELQSRQDDMIDDIATLFYTLQTGKNFLSLLDAVDDGTLGATSYGGLLRSTYTGIKGNYINIAGALSLANLRTQFAACTHGNQKPDLIVTTKAQWAKYEALAALASRTVVTNRGYPQLTRTGIAPSIQALKGQMGFDVLWFSGQPLVVDESAPAGYMLLLNTKHLFFRAVKSTDPDYTVVKFAKGSIEGVYTDVPKTQGFAFSGFNKPIDQYGKVGHIILMGNLISDSPRHLGVMIGLT